MGPHPEHKKKKSKDPKLSKFFVSTDYKYTLDERLNMVVDKIAGEAYQKCNVRSDEVIADAQWNAIRDTYGTVTWNHYVISGKTGTTIKRCLQKEQSRQWKKKCWASEMALCEQNEHNWLVSHDEKLHKMMEVAAVKAGQKVSSMKMAQGILATNALLKTQGRTTLARCSCCHKAVETLNHLVGHCPEPRVRAVRNSIIQHVHSLLAELCKHSKARQLVTQLKAIWSLETIKEACKETNGSAMVGGITEGEKWLGLSTSIKRDVPCGGFHSGQVTSFNNNSANEDHSWGVLWEGNEKTME